MGKEIQELAREVVSKDAVLHDAVETEESNLEIREIVAGIQLAKEKLERELQKSGSAGQY